jgi:hypothetical protein
MRWMVTLRMSEVITFSSWQHAKHLQHSIFCKQEYSVLDVTTIP